MEKFDVIIIGGSYAGLSAALSLARLSKKIMVIDNGKPCNQTVQKSYNFLTQNGNSPQQIVKTAKEQILAYPTVRFWDDKVIEVNGEDGDFEVKTVSGHEFAAKKILFATGVRDTLPEIDGYSACWGTSIVHCPYCHGYEFSGKKAAILAEGEAGRQLLNLLAPLHPELFLICQNGDFEDSRKDGICLVEHSITSIEHQDGQLKSILLDDGSRIAADVLYINPEYEQHSALPEAIGCEMTEKKMIFIDSDHQTSVPGVYACGDCTSLMRSIANAVAAGNLAGAIINKVLSEKPLLVPASN